jgi:hypothetical protein
MGFFEKNTLKINVHGWHGSMVGVAFPVVILFFFEKNHPNFRLEKILPPSTFSPFTLSCLTFSHLSPAIRPEVEAREVEYPIDDRSGDGFEALGSGVKRRYRRTHDATGFGEGDHVA